MAIINRKKIRKDVLELMDKRQRAQNRIIHNYFESNQDQKLFYQKVWKKIKTINESFLKRKINREEIRGLLTFEEKLLIAKLFRYEEDKLAEMYQKLNPISNDMIIEKHSVENFSVEWQIPPNIDDGLTILYIHGGGFIIGSVNDHRLLTVEIAQQLHAKVLSVDYRLAPEYQFPTHLNDCVNAYKWLLSKKIKPSEIIIAGDSAGGNLTLTTLLKLKQDKLPSPRGAICISPVTDLTFTDDSFYLNAETDPVLADKGIFWWTEAYIGDQKPTNPLISPLFGNLVALPSLLIQVSTCEMLYGDSERFAIAAKAAGVDVTFESWDNMLHVFQSFGLKKLPEAKEAIKNMKKFVKKLYS
jgi:acetyl esterase/lipase